MNPNPCHKSFVVLAVIYTSEIMCSYITYQNIIIYKCLFMYVSQICLSLNEAQVR